MKTMLTLFTITLSFILTSCYTQFATVREDEGYVVKRDRVYKKYEEPNDTEESEQAYDDSQADDDRDYYADDEYADDEAISDVEYHYSSRPYVYLYRFTHYDPWYDEYVYYNRPVTVISVQLAPRYRYYDPYWASFYCSPYDYCDPWFGWCGYGYVSYYPYYYGHYYYDRYYGGWYDGYYGYGGYRHHNYRYDRDYYASNWGRRPFTSSHAGRLAQRPDRPDRPDAITRPERPLDMPDTRPVISRPDRQKQQPYTLDSPVKNSDNRVSTQPAGYKRSKITNNERKYQRRYYNSSERIKNELSSSRNEVKRTTRKYPINRVSKDNNTTKPVRRTYKYNTDRREQHRVEKPKTRTTRDKPTYKRSNTISKPKSSSRESSTSKRTVQPRSSERKSYTPKVRSTPRSSSRSSYTPRSTVRSTPSRSSGSSSSRSSGGSHHSSSGSSKSSGGKRPR